MRWTRVITSDKQIHKPFIVSYCGNNNLPPFVRQCYSPFSFLYTSKKGMGEKKKIMANNKIIFVLL